MLKADKKAKEEADKINAADGLIFQSEKQLKDYGDKIPAEKKATIETALAGLKTAHDARDIAGIDSAMTSLNAAWETASQEMYAAMNEQQGGANANPGADANANADSKQRRKRN
jgi:molecular chaperone DnaK